MGNERIPQLGVPQQRPLQLADVGIEKLRVVFGTDLVARLIKSCLFAVLLGTTAANPGCVDDYNPHNPAPENSGENPEGRVNIQLFMGDIRYVQLMGKVMGWEPVKIIFMLIDGNSLVYKPDGSFDLERTLADESSILDVSDYVVGPGEFDIKHLLQRPEDGVSAKKDDVAVVYINNTRGMAVPLGHPDEPFSDIPTR